MIFEFETSSNSAETLTSEKVSMPAHSSWFGRTIFVIAALLVSSGSAFAQNRVDLDDLNIKGELINDNRLRMSNRDQHKISDRVTYRQNFRKEVTDGLEVSWPETDSARVPASKGGAQ